MRKLSEHCLCFAVTVEELLRYGKHPLMQLVRNSQGRKLFSEVKGDPKA